MSNPTQSFSGAVEGVWLLPYTGGDLVSTRKAWIGAKSPSFTRDRSIELFTPPSRESEVSHAGALHLPKGEIDGELHARFSLSSDQWMARLDYLVENQKKWNVWMVTPKLRMKVELGSLTQEWIPMRWIVSVPFRQVT